MRTAANKTLYFKNGKFHFNEKIGGFIVGYTNNKQELVLKASWAKNYNINLNNIVK